MHHLRISGCLWEAGQSTCSRKVQDFAKHKEVGQSEEFYLDHIASLVQSLYQEEGGTWHRSSIKSLSHFLDFFFILKKCISQIKSPYLVLAFNLNQMEHSHIFNEMPPFKNKQTNNPQTNNDDDNLGKRLPSIQPVPSTEAHWHLLISPGSNGQANIPRTGSKEK